MDQPLARIDFEQAVENLQYTGEFHQVDIDVAGDALTIRVDETADYSGNFSIAASLDSDDGIVGRAGVHLQEFPKSGMSLEGAFAVSENYAQGSVDLASNSFLFDRAGGFRLFYGNTFYDDEPYKFKDFGVSPYLTFELDEAREIELSYALFQGDIYDVDPETSGILSSEAGARTSSEIAVAYVYNPEPLNETGLDPFFRLELSLGGLGGDAQYARSGIEANTTMPIGTQGVLMFAGLKGGAVTGLGGDTTRVVDRFAIGGQTLRGFERGTISPRDICNSCAPSGGDIDAIVGGNYYAVVNLELQVPLKVDALSGLTGLVFGDLGSAWGNDNAANATGFVNENATIRSSTGLGVKWSSSVADVELTYGIPLKKGTGDKTQRFGFFVKSRF